MRHFRRRPVLFRTGGTALGGGTAPELSDLMTRQGQTMALGVWSGTSGAADFQTWLAAPVDLADKHADRSSWAGMLSSITDYGAANAAASQAIVWSIPPMLATGTTLAAAAAGSYDVHYTAAAEAVLAAHNKTAGPILVRTGWEQNGSWQPWAAQDATTGDQFKAMWIKFVARFRAVSNRFKFIWSPNQGQANPDLSWPGAAFVDLIGMDVYYNAGTNAGDGVGYFGFVKTDTYGLDWLVAKGAAEARPICIPEWGVKGSQGANVGEPGPATETSSQAAFVSLFAAWMRTNSVFYSTYWDSNLDIDCKLSSGQYPLTGARFKLEFGAPSFTSSATANLTGNGSTPFAATLATTPPATFSLSSNADGFGVAGATLSLPAQTWISGGDNTREVTITARDARGLTATQAYTLTVVAPITDLYPAYDVAFDPLNGFYKVGSNMATTVAGFLALPGVSYAADPTAGFSAAGYLADDTYGLKITIPSTSALSLYGAVARPANAGGTYHCLTNIVRSAEATTRVGLNRDGSSLNWRSAVRDAGSIVGADANFGAMTDPDAVGITISGSAVKYFVANALARTETTSTFGAKPLDTIYIGDGTGGEARWNANIQRILARYSTDADATAAAMTIEPPSVITVGTLQSSPTGLTYNLSTGGITATENDILFGIFETANETPPNTPTNWNWLPAHGVGTPGDVAATAEVAGWLRVPASPPTTLAFGDSGDHTTARIFLIRGCKTTGTPVVELGGSAGSASDPFTVDGGTTTTDANLIIQTATHGEDNAADFIASMTNASLLAVTSLCEVGTTQGNGGGIGAMSGIKAIAGVVGAATFDPNAGITMPQNIARAAYAFLPA